MSFASFQPTPAEVAYAAQIFESTDPQKLGIVTGDAAVPVLAGSNLSPDKLGEIWAIADNDNNGFLTRKGVTVAVRLIGWAQRGEAVSEALLAKGARRTLLPLDPYRPLSRSSGSPPTYYWHQSASRLSQSR